MRPVISSDIMGNRNVEVVPVGAWVEPADDDFQPDALVCLNSVIFFDFLINFLVIKCQMSCLGLQIYRKDKKIMIL